MAWLDKRAEDMWSNNMAALGGLKIRDDPEAIFQEGWLLCDVGAHRQGLPHLRRAVEKGYFAAPTLRGSRHFDAMRLGCRRPCGDFHIVALREHQHIIVIALEPQPLVERVASQLARQLFRRLVHGLR